MSDWAAREQRAKVIAAYGSLAIPVCIAFATVAYNYNERTQSAAESCREKTLAFYDNASAALEKLQGLQNAGQSVKADITNRQAIALDLLTASCARGGVQVPPGVSSVIERLRGFATEDSTRASLEASAVRAVEQSPVPASRADSVAPGIGRVLPSGGPVRVYVHISEEAQRGAATIFARALEAQTLDGRAVDVPGIELVSPQPSSTLRCLKKSDCDRAGELRAIIGRISPGMDLAVSDLSGRYERERGVKAGTYEIWLSKDAQLTEARTS